MLDMCNCQSHVKFRLDQSSLTIQGTETSTRVPLLSFLCNLHFDWRMDLKHV